jgi:exopolysaccharide biosynthesis protein
MKSFLSKPYRWAALYSLVLAASFSLVLLDTFVIPRAITPVVQPSAAVVTTTTSAPQTTQAQASATQTPVVGELSYQDENISITIEIEEKYGATIYIADIQLADASLLKTALADNMYGRNIKETTSDMAEANGAILAINGDYYGFRSSGYVLRNGVLYRSAARAAGDDEALVIDDAGNFSIINESQVSMSSLDSGSIWQILSFGPALVVDGQIADNLSQSSQDRANNPRTAIGQVSALHYIIIVCDGAATIAPGCR